MPAQPERDGTRERNTVGSTHAQAHVALPNAFDALPGMLHDGASRLIHPPPDRLAAEPGRRTDPAALARLSEPELALRPLKGLVVIDEVQRRSS